MMERETNTRVFVMLRLDLGISRHQAHMPAPAARQRAGSTVKAPPGDAKIKSWHEDRGMTIGVMTVGA
jgi:hypothetical protein